MSWLLVWLLAAPSAAQFAPASNPLSVYSVRPSLDLGVAIGGVAVGGGLYLLRSDITDEHCPCDPSRVNAFDRGVVGDDVAIPSALTDGLVGLLVALPAGADWVALRGDKPVFAEDMLVYGETLSVELAAASVVQYSVQRPTPRAYAASPGYMKSPNGYGSMYSEQAALASGALSAAAMTAALRYGDSVLPWLVAAGAGVGVGALRVASGNAFYTDAAAGVLAGMAIGAGVPWLHRRRRSLVGPLSGVEIIPEPGGLALRARF